MAAIDEMVNAFVGIKDSLHMKKLFKELFTPAEIKTLELRWLLVKKLYEGIPQRKIASELGISLCKITRGSKVLKSKESLIARILEKNKKSKI